MSVSVLITVDDVQADMGTNTGDLGNTQLVQSYIDALTPAIEYLAGPLITVNRTLALDGGDDSVMLPWAFSAVVSVVESGVTLNPGDYVPDGTVGILWRGTTLAPNLWYPGRRNIVVTVTTGLTAVPGNVRLAALLLFRHLWETRLPRRQSQPQDGVMTPAGFLIPNRVAELLISTAAVNRMPGFA
jgi:hypothetical protein